MICIVDFDKTFLKNDFFKECFYQKLLYQPLEIIRHFIIERGTILDLKYQLLSQLEIKYQIENLVNPIVKDWLIDNQHKYEKIIVVSASPDFFVKRVLRDYPLFDEIHGSRDINLKGVAKLKYIQDNWGSEFEYIGDSKADTTIFKASKGGYRITKKGLVHVL
jgi:hypothetical protein